MELNLTDTEEMPVGKKNLSVEELARLDQQNSRLVPEFKAKQLEQNAQKHWDLFYKRNETRFFKDRRWTTREFQELLSTESQPNPNANDELPPKKVMLEVGCGVGNLIFPLIEDKCNNYFIYACDFSARAINFVQENPLYNQTSMKAFQCDITTEDIFKTIPNDSVDIITMIFVLSAIHPDNFNTVFSQMFSLLGPGGVLLFRDYGLHDMAQIRFKPGHKISENLYMRQDGTRY